MKIDCPEVRARLEEIAAANGGVLTPSAIWQDARGNPDGPLHPLFKWDLQEAAEAYWTEQARAIIRAVRLVVTVEESSLYPSPAYWTHDPAQKTGEEGYVPLIQVRSDEEKARIVIERECGCALAAIHRARQIAEVLGMRSEVERLLGAIEQVKARATNPPKQAKRTTRARQARA